MNKVLLLSILLSSSADCMNFSYVKSIGFGIARSSMGISHAYVRSVGLAQSTLSQSVRFYSKEDHSLKLDYVSVDKNGLVTISQPDYPEFDQTVHEAYLRNSKGPFYDEDRGLYYTGDIEDPNDYFELQSNISDRDLRNIRFSKQLDHKKNTMHRRKESINLNKKNHKIFSGKTFDNAFKIVDSEWLSQLPYAASGKLTMHIDE
ncbi:hypothetical protein [Candidatus Cytomitobacter primus]|uniref:Uncharacterized protein n=1 Tax=Candidatus Cytomitobacter primus TaxID=2066024 RepID=A0A5C0UEZ6_9PROT|nr:hypothetical protein [Candidatus Cytomitobacter primus]QEK38676.1 hypothetical protein FZC34_02020 [Candidatus Cytomitobacter primus]